MSSASAGVVRSTRHDGDDGALKQIMISSAASASSPRTFLFARRSGWDVQCPAGELKHGPLALIGTGTPVVVVDNSDPKLAANIAEVEARGARIIDIGSAASTVPVVGGTVAPSGPLESVIPLQILARTLALTLGLDVDKPRNLAKSVTVE